MIYCLLKKTHTHTPLNKITKLPHYLSYFSLRSLNKELCNFVTSLSTSSWTTLPLTSTKLATLFFELVSRIAPDLLSLKLNTKLYLSSYLKKKDKY